MTANLYRWRDVQLTPAGIGPLILEILKNEKGPVKRSLLAQKVNDLHIRRGGRSTTEIDRKSKGPLRALKEQGVIEVVGFACYQLSRQQSVHFNTIRKGASEAHSAKAVASSQTRPNIFVVHGQDSDAKGKLSVFLSGLSIIPIFLDEQTHEGKTLIESFESHASQSSFALVLLTPDDYGGREKRNFKRRARQNVILELGWFAGHLGRGRVCVLKKGDLEWPSDILGTAYVDMDAENWGHRLRNELSKAGVLPSP